MIYLQYLFFSFTKSSIRKVEKILNKNMFDYILISAMVMVQVYIIYEVGVLYKYLERKK